MQTARTLIKAVGTVFKGKTVAGVEEYLNVVGTKGFTLKNVYPKDCDQKYLNLNYLEELFKFRAIKRCLEVAKDFNEEMMISNEFQEAINSCSNDLLRTSYSHCYYIILKVFNQTINEVEDQKIKAVFTRLAIMYALSNILDDNWSDVIANSEFRHIKKYVNKVMEELRPDCIGLVDAFDYTDQALKSAIGRYDGNVYEALLGSAKKSTLNQKDPFEGYEENLKPHLNKELLKRGNKPIQNIGKF